MFVVYFILLLLAVVCFLLASAGVTFRRVNLLALGLFFWVLTSWLQMFKSL